MTLESGLDVLEPGCGKGVMLCAMAEHYPKSTFTGLEYNSESVKKCKRRAEAAGITNINFIQGDVRQSAFYNYTFCKVTQDLARILPTSMKSSTATTSLFTAISLHMRQLQSIGVPALH